MATAQVSSPEPSVGFPPKGSLRKVPFPRLIREVARRKLDGSLYLLSGQTKKVVFFTKGQPVFVRSNVLSECLGQILAQEGLITQEQCEQTLEAIRRTGKKQGELLVEMGILSEGNLRYGLEAQLRAKLFEIFSWEEGRYQFKGDAPELQFGITLKASAEGVIVEAIQDQYSEERASEVLEPVASKYPVLQADAMSTAELTLLPEERHFVACLDGSRSVGELLEDPGTPAVPTPGSLLCGLLAAGLLRLVDAAQPREAWPDPPDFAPTGGTDDELRPSFEAQALITEYEDTPLPGELPKSPDLLGDHEEGFEGVGEDSGVVRVSAVMRGPELPEDLVAAEPAGIEETFDDDQIELTEDGDGDVDLANPTLPPLLGAPSEVPASEDETAALDDDAALDDMLMDGEELPSLDFEAEPPTAVDGPAAVDEPAAVPEPVALTGTMPTPELLSPVAPVATVEPGSEPVAPPLVGAPPPVARTDSPVPPAPVAPPSLSGSGVRPLPSAASGPSSQPAPVAPSPVGSSPVGSSSVGPAPVVSGSPTVGTAPAGPEEDLLDLAPDDDLLMLDENVEAAAADLLGPAVSGLTQPPTPVSALEDDDGFEADGFEAEAIDDDSLLEVDDLELAELDDELELDDDDAPEAAPAAAAAPGNDDLLDFDDLDDIDLGGDQAPASAPLAAVDDDLEADDDGPEDMMGALRFNDGQAAIADERWEDAIVALEEAYESGFDVAELHAMLAYARFQASGLDEQTSQHAFELLDYAQQMDPSLDLVHAYRGAIHRSQGDIPQAREALDRALELNPYCELAMEILDAIG